MFRKVEKHYQELSLRDGIGASPFEILTATAFHIFNQEQIKIGIVEVGMGGKEDATNLLNNQAVSVISKIARDHQNFLGNTLEEIALHKAGILRPQVPYIVNKQNENNVKLVIENYANTIGAGPLLSHQLPDFRKGRFSKLEWREFTKPLLPIHRDNVSIAAVAARQAVESIGLNFWPAEIVRFLFESRNTVNPGRTELVRVPLIFGQGKDIRGQPILVDGAHNPNAAKTLDEHVRVYHRRVKIKGEGYPGRAGWPVTWVLAMTEGKDAHGYCKVLLRPGDNVITTTFGPVDGMPSVKPMDPKQLLDIAMSVQPGVMGIAMPKEGALRALCAAKFITKPNRPVVLTGSLYLVGDFHRELRSRNSPHYWTAPKFKEDREIFQAILKEEEHRVNHWLSAHSRDPSIVQPADAFWEDSGLNKHLREWNDPMFSRKKKRAIQEEMETLDREMESLAAEEQRIGHQESSNEKCLNESAGSDNTASAGEPVPPAEEQNGGVGIPGGSTYS